MSASEVPGADTDCMLWGMLANGLSSNSVLCKLSLAYCHVSSAGVGYLAAALEHNPLGALQCLDLSGRMWGLGFGVWGLGLGFGVQGPGFGAWGLGLGAPGLSWLKVWGRGLVYAV